MINYLLACNLGIFSGIIFQYITSMKYVFQKDNFVHAFSIYILTFFLGLALANGTMYISYELGSLSFLHSKLISMGVPFFIMYSLRKRLLGLKSQVLEEA